MGATMPVAIPMGPTVAPFLGLPYMILNMNPKKELLWGLWVGTLASEIAYCQHKNEARDKTIWLEVYRAADLPKTGKS